jgi:biopolymer transport protein ExbD
MAYRPSEGRNQKKQSPPVSPDLVPIMNLFMALIPFLLMMIVISQVALVALNFSASGGGGGGGEGGGSGATPKEIKVIVMASEGNQIFPGFEIREPESGPVMIRNNDNKGRFNFVSLNTTLGNIKTRNQQLGDITIVVYPDVQYGTLIQTIDLCKQNGFPNVIYKPATVSYGSGG